MPGQRDGCQLIGPLRAHFVNLLKVEFQIAEAMPTGDPKLDEILLEAIQFLEQSKQKILDHIGKDIKEGGISDVSERISLTTKKRQLKRFRRESPWLKEDRKKLRRIMRWIGALLLSRLLGTEGCSPDRD